MFILLILSLLYSVEAKAVVDDPYRAYYDHMYQNMYLRPAHAAYPESGQYENKYVPYVDGRPIYIPNYDERQYEVPHYPDTNHLAPKPKQLPEDSLNHFSQNFPEQVYNENAQETNHPNYLYDNPEVIDAKLEDTNKEANAFSKKMGPDNSFDSSNQPGEDSGFSNGDYEVFEDLSNDKEQLSLPVDLQGFTNKLKTKLKPQPKPPISPKPDSKPKPAIPQAVVKPHPVPSKPSNSQTIIKPKPQVAPKPPPPKPTRPQFVTKPQSQPEKPANVIKPKPVATKPLENKGTVKPKPVKPKPSQTKVPAKPKPVKSQVVAKPKPVTPKPKPVKSQVVAKPKPVTPKPKPVKSQVVPKPKPATPKPINKPIKPAPIKPEVEITQKPVKLQIVKNKYETDHGYKKPIYSIYDNYDSPVKVEAKVKPSDYYETPIKVSSNHKSSDEDFAPPSVVHSSVEKTADYDYDTPVVVEALKKKPNSDKHDKYGDGEYEKPVVVEALTKLKPQMQNQDKESNKYVHALPTYDKTQSKPELEPRFEEYEKLLKERNFEFSQFGSQSDSNINSKEEQIEQISNDSDESNFDALSRSFEDEENKSDIDDSGLNEPRLLGDPRSSMKSVWSIMSSFHSQERNKFRKCLTPDHEPGNCMPIQICPVPNLQLTLQDLMNKVCSIDDVFIGICCPEFPAETLKVKWDNITESPPENKEMKNEAPPQECGELDDSEKLRSWPWMAPLISAATRRIFCGGVLVNNQYVLTAAHCTRKIPHNQILVILGPMTSQQDPTNQEFEVVEIKRHAQYNPRTMQNDLALLKLAKPVTGEKVRFICLPEERISFENQPALMLGWQGSFAASKNEETLNVISTAECKKGVKMTVSESTLCTEGRTEDVMCNLDSGAPLIMKHNNKYVVIGVLTWNRNDCDSSFPTVFTRVSHFRKWIDNHISKT